MRDLRPLRENFDYAEYLVRKFAAHNPNVDPIRAIAAGLLGFASAAQMDGYRAALEPSLN